MFEYKEKQYELKFTIGRLKLIERAADGKSAMAQLAADDNGMMSLAACERFFSFGLKEAGSDTFCTPQKGAEVCDDMITEQGYSYVIRLIQESLYHDCPFLFRAA